MVNNWKGWIIDKGLKDKFILSKLNVINSKIEENMEGDEKQIWTLYTIKISNEKIDEVSKVLENLIKTEYYTHFTNGKELIIIFSGKSFKIKLNSVGKETNYGISDFEAKTEDKKIWQSAVEYGTTNGKVDPRYLIKVN